MAGRKVFTSGEILTAADVNSFLMNQVVAVFADSTARSSAIPSPSEGMVTFREDQDVVEVYDGSAFKTVGGLVAVKSVLFTGVQTASVNGGDNVAVTDLSITHEVADPANRLIISAFLGAAANSAGFGLVGLAIHDGAGLINIGDARGTRQRVTSGGIASATDSGGLSTNPSFTTVYAPGAGSKTYTVRAINMADATKTIFVNRSRDNVDAPTRPAAVSSLVIQEVAV